MQCDILYSKGEEEQAKKLRKHLDKFYREVCFFSSRTYIHKPFPEKRGTIKGDD